MTMRGVLMVVVLVFLFGDAAGLLGATAESIVWTAAAAVLVWGLLRFLHWRDEWRRLTVTTLPRASGERDRVA